MSTTTLMSSLRVERGPHLLADHAMDEPDRVHWAKALAAFSRRKTHFVEEVRGLTPFARFATLRYLAARASALSSCTATGWPATTRGDGRPAAAAASMDPPNAVMALQALLGAMPVTLRRSTNYSKRSTLLTANSCRFVTKSKTDGISPADA